MAVPREYDETTGNLICERLVEGMSLRKICEDADMPAVSTVMKWLGANPQFAEQYAHAREAQAEALADEIVSIADDEADPAKARVRVDARKWVASKLLPKKYGDRVTQEHVGKDGGPLVMRWVSEAEPSPDA